MGLGEGVNDLPASGGSGFFKPPIPISTGGVRQGGAFRRSPEKEGAVRDTLINRRSILTATALAGVAAAPAGTAVAEAPPARFTPMALPFDPTAIQGLSEKLLMTHHDSYYLGAVRRLTAVEGALATLDPTTAPPYALNGYKHEELLACNSMILHEIYFASLGAPSRPGAQLAR